MIGEQSVSSRVMKLFFLGGVLFLLGLAVIGILAALKRDGLFPAGEWTPYLNVAGILMLLAGPALMMFPGLLSEATRLKAKQSRPLPRTKPTVSAGPGYLNEPAPAVTEKTTELFEAAEKLGQGLDTSPQADPAERKKD